MIRVKICGLTNYNDAFLAESLGADAIGFVFYPPGKRYIMPEKAAEIIVKLNPFVSKVGVFVDANTETINSVSELCNLDYAQLYGQESQSDLRSIKIKIIKALHFNQDLSINLKVWEKYPILVDSGNKDAPGGTGKKLPWLELKETIKEDKIILAGGLNPDNVQEAIRIVQPYAVDVSSGVEKAIGKKDAKIMESFIKRVKGI